MIYVISFVKIYLVTYLSDIITTLHIQVLKSNRVLT